MGESEPLRSVRYRLPFDAGCTKVCRADFPAVRLVQSNWRFRPKPDLGRPLRRCTAASVSLTFAVLQHFLACRRLPCLFLASSTVNDRSKLYLDWECYPILEIGVQVRIEDPIQHTKLSNMAGIKFPIVQAAMSGATFPKLAAVVSNAGVLGSLGALFHDHGEF